MIREWDLPKVFPEPGSPEQDTVFGPWFAVSNAQINQHAQCQRRWWLHKNQAWQGWDRKASHAEKLAYRCSKMNNLNGVSGTILHKIFAAREAFAEAAYNRWSDQMRRRVDAALGEAWDRCMKKYPPIAEIYYKDTVPWPLKADRLKVKIRALFDNFFDIPWLHLIHHELRPAGKYLWEEGAEGGEQSRNKVVLDGTAWWIIRDCVVEFEDGRIEIWDFKTGRPKREDAAQLSLYMMATAEKTGIPIASITGRLLYLDEEAGAEAERVLTLNEEAATAVRAAAVEGAATLQAKLEHPWVSRALLSKFPRTQSRGECVKCDFFECCYGTRDRRFVPEEGIEVDAEDAEHLTVIEPPPSAMEEVRF
jgi:CRISPR/Cas system-associated exonuclease Cas4 (RecB family)